MAIVTEPRAVTGESRPLREELWDWLEANWAPELSVAEWWERLGLAGWSAPALPESAYGRGLPREDAVAVQHTIREFGALGPPSGLGLLLAAPTIVEHGTRDQIDRYVGDIVTGRAAWCQLFSEPAAGSDLAGLQTSAVRDGDEWVVNGQKVWTSGAQYADYGMLIARTDPDAPKHRGITYFAFDMHQPENVDIRPLREMTGRSLFNEVFLTDARVPDAACVGEVNQGWVVANTTLMLERSGLGAGGAGAVGSAVPGTIAGHLDRPAGEFTQSNAGGQGPVGVDDLVELLRVAHDRDERQVDELMAIHCQAEAARYLTLRAKAGAQIPGLGNMAKLHMAEILRRTRDLSLRMLGPQATLHGYTGAARASLEASTGRADTAAITEHALFAQGPAIYGGTDQIQRNILGERVLGLPKAPGPDRTTPFREITRNR